MPCIIVPLRVPPLGSAVSVQFSDSPCSLTGYIHEVP